MQVNRSRAYLASMLMIPLALIVAACGVTPTSPAAPGAAGPGAPQTTSATSQLVNCAATLPEMQGAQVVMIPNTDFPDSGAAIASITSPISAPLQIVQYTACMQVFVKGSVDHVSVPIITHTSSPTAEVIDALNLSGRGWRSTSSFPFDGYNIQRCTKAQLCYTTDALQYYLELEQISDHSRGVLTFMLRLSSPQPLVSCDPALFSVDYYPSSTSVLANAEFPLPPLTRVSGGYGDAAGITTYLCTGDTAASIQTFMESHLPRAGWSPLTANGVRIWKFPSGVGPVYMRIYPVTDPHKWAILTYDSGINLG